MQTNQIIVPVLECCQWRGNGMLPVGTHNGCKYKTVFFSCSRETVTINKPLANWVRRKCKINCMSTIRWCQELNLITCCSSYFNNIIKYCISLNTKYKRLNSFCMSFGTALYVFISLYALWTALWTITISIFRFFNLCQLSLTSDLSHHLYCSISCIEVVALLLWLQWDAQVSSFHNLFLSSYMPVLLFKESGCVREAGSHKYERYVKKNYNYVIEKLKLNR